MIDLTYKTDAFCATFYVNSNDGLSAYKTLVETNGSATVYLSQLDSTLYQLKQAGYKTRRTPSKAQASDESFNASDAALLEKLFA